MLLQCMRMQLPRVADVRAHGEANRISHELSHEPTFEEADESTDEEANEASDRFSHGGTVASAIALLWEVGRRWRPRG